MNNCTHIGQFLKIIGWLLMLKIDLNYIMCMFCIYTNDNINPYILLRTRRLLALRWAKALLALNRQYNWIGSLVILDHIVLHEIIINLMCTVLEAISLSNCQIQFISLYTTLFSLSVTKQACIDSKFFYVLVCKRPVQLTRLAGTLSTRPWTRSGRTVSKDTLPFGRRLIRMAIWRWGEVGSCSGESHASHYSWVS